MKKYDNFIGCFDVLKQADSEKAASDAIYRTGVLGQFNLTFELAWKTLQAVLRMHSVMGAETGSPREILKLGFKVGFIDIKDEQAWLDMLKDRNQSVHIYNESDADDIVSRIFNEYISAFERFAILLNAKINEVE